MHAAGPFDVKMLPQPAATAVETFSRFVLDKRFHGDLDATSNGEMIAAGTTVKGSAAYSALERVTGTLHGHAGSFVLQHTGVMNRGVPSLVITVVPDSGTGALAGLAGTMTIDIAPGGAHAYRFDYTLEPAGA